MLDLSNPPPGAFRRAATEGDDQVGRSALWAALALVLAVTASAGATTTAFTYQGKLTDTAGTPLAGNYDLTFKLFDAETGGNQVGSSILLPQVPVSQGLFTVELDFGGLVFISGADRWLETAVKAVTLSPRTKITSVPLAMFSQAPWVSSGSDIHYNLGQVGIGVANPTTKLDVDGMVKMTGFKLTTGAAAGCVLTSNGTGTGTWQPPTIAADALSDYVGDITNLASTDANPTILHTIADTDGPVSVAISGRYAYVANVIGDNMQVMDISNPANPVVVGTVTTADSPSSIAVSGRYAYVTCSGGSKLQVIDIANPASPAVVGETPTGVYPESVAVSGRYAVVANMGADSVQVIDVSNPTNPTIAGTLAVTSDPMAVAISGKYAFVACYTSNNVKVVDISNPASLSVVGTCPVGAHPLSIAIQGRYAYVACSGNGQLYILDIKNPTSMAASWVATEAGTQCVAVAGRYAYVVCSIATENNLQVFDVSVPGSYTEVGSLTTGEHSYCVAVSGKHAVVGVQFPGSIHVVEISGIESTAVTAHTLEAGNLQVRGDASVAGNLSVSNGLNVAGTGNFSGTVAANGVVLTSDAALKTNIHTLSGSLDKVLKLRGVGFDWKQDKFGEGPQVGLVAQEVRKVTPELVSKNQDGYLGVHYANLVPLLIEAIKEQQREIDELKALLTATYDR